MSVTDTYHSFVNEPMDLKCVESIPGIGYSYGTRLRGRGYIHVSSYLQLCFALGV